MGVAVDETGRDNFPGCIDYFNTFPYFDMGIKLCSLTDKNDFAFTGCQSPIFDYLKAAGLKPPFASGVAISAQFFMMKSV